VRLADVDTELPGADGARSRNMSKMIVSADSIRGKKSYKSQKNLCEVSFMDARKHLTANSMLPSNSSFKSNRSSKDDKR